MYDDEIDTIFQKLMERGRNETPAETTARYLRLLERFGGQIPRDEMDEIRAMLEADAQTKH